MNSFSVLAGKSFLIAIRPKVFAIIATAMVGRSVGAGIADRDGAAVRLGAGRTGEPGRSAGAGNILDDDALAEDGAHLFGDDAGTSEVPPAANGTIMVIGRVG
jgi:hypothetical protein